MVGFLAMESIRRYETWYLYACPYMVPFQYIPVSITRLTHALQSSPEGCTVCEALFYRLDRNSFALECGRMPNQLYHPWF